MKEADGQQVPSTMASSASSTTSWESKEVKASDVPSLIPNGSTVYIGSTAATPEAVLNELVNQWSSTDIQIIQMIPGGNLPHLEENIDRFRTLSFFSFRKTMFYNPDDINNNPSSASQREGLADYKPMTISSIGRLLQEKIVTVDVAVIKVTPPHKGFVSLGFGVDVTLDFVRHAKKVIAEVNLHMPWTEGPSKIPIDQINHWISNDEQLKSTSELWPEFMCNIATKYCQPDRVMNAIGKNIAKEISDGATLKFDWNPVVYSVLPHLYEHKNLGLHTDVFVEGVYQLQKHGIINNKMKTINTGRSVVSQAHGASDEIYDYLDRNPAIEVHPTSYVNDPQVMGQIQNLIVIIGAFKIDITGQVTTDSIGHKFYGGVWSTDDSVRGARLSQNGKPIVVLPSKSSHGRSNILFELPPGTGVSITRSDVEYVITEYGTAYLYGKSIRERCLALIEIAHPDFRTELFNRAKENHYLSQSQPGKSFRSIYPEQLESYYTSKSGKTVFVRPIKAADEDMLRTFFHKLSDHSVYLRYFRRLRSMSHRILQKYTDVDYMNDMALLALYPIQDNAEYGSNDNMNGKLHNSFQQQYEIVAIAQWMSDPREGAPEIAFQVRDDWHGEGLSSYLFLRLTKVSNLFGVHQFKADVLTENKAMRHVFEKSGISYTTKVDFGVLSYAFDLKDTFHA